MSSNIDRNDGDISKSDEPGRVRASSSGSFDENLRTPGCKGCDNLAEKCETIKKAWRKHCTNEVTEKQKEALEQKKELEDKLRKLESVNNGLKKDMLEEQQKASEVRKQLHRVQHEKGEMEEQMDRARQLIGGYSAMRAEAMELLEILEQELFEVDAALKSEGDAGTHEQPHNNMVNDLGIISKMASRIGQKRIELERAIKVANDLAVSHGSAAGVCEQSRLTVKSPGESMVVDDPAPQQQQQNSLINHPEPMEEDDDDEILLIDVVTPRTPSPTAVTPIDPNQSTEGGFENQQTCHLFSQLEGVQDYEAVKIESTSNERITLTQYLKSHNDRQSEEN